jgi:hypothetical protein
MSADHEQAMTAPAAKYSAVETLRNGQRLEIRALRPQDRDEFVAAAGRLGVESLYRRFFVAKQVWLCAPIAVVLWRTREFEKPTLGESRSVLLLAGEQLRGELRQPTGPISAMR